MTSANQNTNRLHETLARLFVKTLFAISALACMAPSATITVTHQLAHVEGPRAWALASASVISVLLAGLTPLSYGAAIASGEWRKAIACVIVFVGCVAFNLVSAIGSYSASRAEQVGASESVSRLQAQIDEGLSALAPLNAATGGATAEMIKNEQNRMRVDRLWELSGECKSADGPKERAFCASYMAKGTAIKAAEKAKELEADINALRARIDAAPKGALPGQPSDPQSANISAVLSAFGYNTTPSSVGIYLNLLLAVVVEIVAALGPTVLSAVLHRDHPKSTTDDGVSGGPRPGVKHGPLTENSDTEAMSAESGQEGQRRTPDDDGDRPKPRARRRARRANKTHSAPTRHLLKSKENSNVVPFLPHTGAELGAERIKRVVELHDMGLSNCAIGRELGVSERTVRRDLKEAVKHSSAGMVFAAE